MKTVYALIGIQTNDLFYIGETKHPLSKRIYQHLYRSDIKQGLKYDIIRANNKSIDIIGLCSYDGSVNNADYLLEGCLIAYFHSEGHVLSNYYIDKYASYPEFTNHYDGGRFISICKSAREIILKKYPNIFGNK